MLAEVVLQPGRARFRVFCQAFGGGGFVVTSFSSPQLMQNLTNIENLLRSPGNVEGTGDNWFDLNYETGPNQLIYDFQLNPRGRNAEPRPKGRLTLSLRRRPSLFTDQVLPGQFVGRVLRLRCCQAGQRGQRERAHIWAGQQPQQTQHACRVGWQAGESGLQAGPYRAEDQ